MEALDPLAAAPRRAPVEVHLRVIEVGAVTVGPGVWVPAAGDAATERALERLRAVGHVLDCGESGGTVLDPFLVDGQLRLVYGGDWLAALRELGVTHTRALVAVGLPEDAAFRLLLAHLLRPMPASATRLQIHRAEQPIRALIAAAARARQRQGGQQTAAKRWGSDRPGSLASADFAEAMGPGVPALVADVLERALAAVTSRGDSRSKHKLLGLTSSADEYEAIEKIIAAADGVAEPESVRAVAAAQLAALDTAQPPAISTALRRVIEARHDARARSLGPADEPAESRPAAPGDDVIDAVVATLQSCVERLDALLTPPSTAAAAVRQADAGALRFRAAAEAAREIPQLIATVAEVL